MRTSIWLIVGSLAMAVVTVVPETHQDGFRAELVGAGVISRDGGLPMIDVGDDRHVPDVLAKLVHRARRIAKFGRG